MFPLVALALLAFPVLAIVALVKAINLGDALRGLELRLAVLERRSAGSAAPAAERPLQSGPPPQSTTAAEPPPVPSQADAAGEAPPAPLEPRAAPVSQSPAPSIGASPSSSASLEERFGTRWVVWVGGVALALGGIFLVRYSIEQGLIGPGVRIALGALLAAALIAVGEWARRHENFTGLTGVPSAHIPGVLTAAGTTVAYATVYAAYELYGFMPPGTAFVLLGIVALLGLAAALLHGPALAGLGVVGAFLTPLLVASKQPDYWALYIYVAVVSAAAFALARLRLWQWLAIAATVLGALWTVAGIGVTEVDAIGAHVFSALAGFALAALLLVCGLSFGPPARPGQLDLLSSFALAVYLAVATILVLASRHDPVALGAFVVLTAATVAIAWRTEAAIAAVPAAAVLAMLVMADWAVAISLDALVAPSGPAAPAIPEPEHYLYTSHLALAAAWAALFGITGFLAQGRSTRALPAMLWAATAVFAPLAMLIAVYYRIAALDRSLPFAALALLLAALFAVATESLVQSDRRPGQMAASAMFATGALAALALALTFALEKGWLTIGLALMAPGAAWVSEKRPLPWLRWLAAVMAAIVTARLGYEPRIVGDQLGTTPVFNWLLYGYGVPAAAFWFAAWRLRRRADDLPARIVDAAAILFTVLLAVVEIRHYVGEGDIWRRSSSLMESALYVNVGLAMTIGLERVRGRTGSIVHNAGALVVAGLTLASIVAELLLATEPRFAAIPVPGAFFNLILLGYGLPAVLAIALALIARTTRPISYRVVAAATAVILALFYLSLEVRRLFHGPILAGPTTDAEQYAYSTVWLVFGIVLLTIGFMLRSQPARFAALAVIALTIAKVFLIDVANVAGIYRALSMTGLGVVLLGIGWLYQRLLYVRAPAAE